MPAPGSMSSLCMKALSEAVERSPVGLAVLDEQSRFVLDNEMLAKVHRMTPEQIVGMHPMDLTPPEVRGEFFRDAEANLKDPNLRSLELEMPAHRADGSQGWVKVNVTFVRDDTGRAQRFVSVAQDVTRRR